MALFEKLATIHSTVDRLQKDGTNQGMGGFKFMSEKQLKEVFHPLFQAHKIVLVPTNTSSLTTTKGEKMALTTFVQGFDILDLESGERLSMQLPAAGSDSSDKGAYKAITGCIKYVITTLFLIPTGDDPEADGNGKREIKQPTRKQLPTDIITPAQVQRFHALRKAKNVDDAYAKDLIVATGKASSKDLTVAEYETIMNQLEAL